MTALPKPAYVMSEPHLSGWRVVLGYETLADAQAAQSAVSAPEAREGEAVGYGRGKSRGQVAYEGWAQGLPGCEWANQTETQKRAWELSAKAVLSASPTPDALKGAAKS